MQQVQVHKPSKRIWSQIWGRKRHSRSRVWA